MENRVFIANFDQIADANIAKMILADHEIPCVLDGQHMSSIMPHMQLALGGVRLSVANKDVVHAKKLLNIQEPEVQKLKVETQPQLIRRAKNTAVLGFFMLPVVSNLYSIFLFRSAYKQDPKAFWIHKNQFIIGMIFNMLPLGVALLFGIINSIGT